MLTEEQKARLAELKANTERTEDEESEFQELSKLDVKEEKKEEVDVDAMVKAAVDKATAQLAETYEGKINSITEELNGKIEETVNTYESKISAIKDEYVSEDAKKELEKKENDAKILKDNEARAQAEKDRLAKIAEDEKFIATEKRKYEILAVANEAGIPTHFVKYITGNTKEEMAASAKSIMADFTKSEEDFKDEVAKAVEAKFAAGVDTQTGTTSTLNDGMTLVKFKALNINDKAALMISDKQTYDEMIALLRKERGTF